MSAMNSRGASYNNFESSASAARGCDVVLEQLNMSVRTVLAAGKSYAQENLCHNSQEIQSCVRTGSELLNP